MCQAYEAERKFDRWLEEKPMKTIKKSKAPTPIAIVDDEFYRRAKKHELACRFGIVNMLSEDWTPQEFEYAVKRRNEILYEKESSK